MASGKNTELVKKVVVQYGPKIVSSLLDWWQRRKERKQQQQQQQQKP